ncbi:CDP-alcohol phosphatidyltransferase family protein [Eubacterium xylanophilum]|uniref:CDP-alcohol phosphatidyltransferase family protein n=1 Tax=Eubacterium xylanophilum TaxID=39497 RepID=UPI00047B9DD0|nr:CDP-alcohol phosphatidyltransferase family protein [Eubacterium xylanophilum]MCR5796553.1 CDP-alcohol phosphatidyltransferase family protein [Eubacterium sp.]
MIGVYNYTVILTYLGVTISFIGIIFSLMGRPDISILCLALAGACDTFDGKVARSKKDRTEKEIIFGIQIDSLCDAICFGVSPAIIAYSLGANTPFGIAVEIVFVLCGVIRLAYFNVLEELKHLHPSGEEQKCYHGLPITSIAIIFPIIFLFKQFMTKPLFILVITFTLLATAFLYITDFKIKKPTNAMVAFIIIFMAIVVLKVLHVF